MRTHFLLLLLFPLFAFSQQFKIDSLLFIIKNSKEDTNKIDVLNKLASEFKKVSMYKEAITNANNALTISERLNFKRGISDSYIKLGSINLSQGNYPESLKYYLSSLKINEEVGNKKKIAPIYNSLGIVYQVQHNYSEALKNYFNSLKINMEINNKNGVADVYANIGTIYVVQNKIDEALENFHSSLKAYQEIEDKQGVAYSYSNIAEVLENQGNVSEALKNEIAGLKIFEEIGDKEGISGNYNALGLFNIKLKKFDVAKQQINKALTIAEEIGSKENIKNSYKALSKLDSILGNFKSAYENYKMYILYRDSLINDENTKKTVRAQMNYEFDKKESLAKAEQEKKDAITNEEKRRQKMFLFSVIGGLLLVAVFSVFMFNRWRVTQKQKAVIEEQKHIVDEQKKLVEEKNKDITDSINYAQRIQKALLASNSLLDKNLGEYFVLFKPKDIVSGDFYWATEAVGSKQSAVGNETANRFYLAVCDSTGHGVPGAFMSLLNISFLNEAIAEKGIEKPNEIFNHVRQRLIENISSEGAQDGMDGILLTCKMENGRRQMEYTGANNAPILVQDGKIIELETDNMPVGLSDRKNSFTLRAVESQTSDLKPQTLYLYTDGFADQFGGPKGKKFKYKQLNEKLLAISDKSLAEQKNILEKTFEDWRGSLEQVDDVLVIGIKV
ncbi:MAG: tetratricopeptide repeat protein [Bacteroidetes bacterium]|nr:tetratricopeptide repeat protein [Bacteroidota bacterium]